MPLPTDITQSIIKLEHAEYRAKKGAWERNERRFAGGEDVFDDLRAFTWEQSNEAAYSERQDRAVYPEFPAMTAERFVGILAQHFPQEGSGLDLGTLSGSDGGRRADMLKANADGVGSDARTLERFWADAMEAAMATKYRWILAEAPRTAPQTLADEEEGARPYLVEYSPLSVPYWHYERGSLQCVRVEIESSGPRIVGGVVKDDTETLHYLMTREGFTGWGEAFQGGGWWIVDDEGMVVGEGEQELSGTWDRTGGEIPMCRLYYERGSRGDQRTGITQLGRIAVAYMDLFSAQMNDAWESGSGVTFLNGVSRSQWDDIVEAGKNNAKWVPVPGEDGSKVTVQSISEGSGSQVLGSTLEGLEKLAMQLIARELVTSPDASGKARQIQFMQGNSPRLASMAGNLEEAMVTSLRFLEQRWTGGDSVQVDWQKQYDLKTVVEKIEGVLQLFSEAEAKSPTLFADMLVAAAKSEGLLTRSDEDEESEETVRSEVRESLDLPMRRTRLSLERDELASEGREAAAARRQRIDEIAGRAA